MVVVDSLTNRRLLRVSAFYADAADKPYISTVDGEGCVRCAAWLRDGTRDARAMVWTMARDGCGKEVTSFVHILVKNPPGKKRDIEGCLFG